MGDAPSDVEIKSRSPSRARYLGHYQKVSSIRTSMSIQGRLERTETNLMNFKWEVT